MENITIKELKILMDCCFLASAAYLKEVEGDADYDFRILYDRPQDMTLELINRKERDDWLKQIRQNVPKAQVVEGIRKILLAEHKKEQIRKDFEEAGTDE